MIRPTVPIPSFVSRVLKTRVCENFDLKRLGRTYCLYRGHLPFTIVFVGGSQVSVWDGRPYF